APLRLDDLLQGRESGPAAQIAVHDTISGQTPDLALISLSLCGLIVARDYRLHDPETPMGPVLRELALECENNLLTIGRLWVDSALYGVMPDMKNDRRLIETVPDSLRVL